MSDYITDTDPIVIHTPTARAVPSWLEAAEAEATLALTAEADYIEMMYGDLFAPEPSDDDYYRLRKLQERARAAEAVIMEWRAAWRTRPSWRPVVHFAAAVQLVLSSPVMVCRRCGEIPVVSARKSGDDALEYPAGFYSGFAVCHRCRIEIADTDHATEAAALVAVTKRWNKYNMNRRK
jgi:hypothetical protein